MTRKRSSPLGLDIITTASITLAIVFLPLLAQAAPLQDATEIQQYTEGCYYNYNHYNEGDRILTNEPCLNCTCHNKMLMCYLRVCPFTKPIGHDCIVEKREDQCCPIITCPEVPVDIAHHAPEPGTELSIPEKYGCSINEKFYPEGAQVPSNPNKPCELCYCIRNRTSCLMQECTLHIDGCTPIYNKGSCCPVRYNCDHENDVLELEDHSSTSSSSTTTTTTVRPTEGFVLTTTMTPSVSSDCIHNNEVYADGASITGKNACEHCYCMRGDIVCAVQECEMPMLAGNGKSCHAVPGREGECCPSNYICEDDTATTEIIEVNTPLTAYTKKEGERKEDGAEFEFTTASPVQDLHGSIPEEDMQLQAHIDDEDKEKEPITESPAQATTVDKLAPVDEMGSGDYATESDIGRQTTITPLDHVTLGTPSTTEGVTGPDEASKLPATIDGVTPETSESPEEKIDITTVKTEISDKEKTEDAEGSGEHGADVTTVKSDIPSSSSSTPTDDISKPIADEEHVDATATPPTTIPMEATEGEAAVTKSPEAGDETTPTQKPITKLEEQGAEGETVDRTTPTIDVTEQSTSTSAPTIESEEKTDILATTKPSGTAEGEHVGEAATTVATSLPEGDGITTESSASPATSSEEGQRIATGVAGADLETTISPDTDKGQTDKPIDTDMQTRKDETTPSSDITHETSTSIATEIPALDKEDKESSVTSETSTEKEIPGEEGQKEHVSDEEPFTKSPSAEPSTDRPLSATESTTTSSEFMDGQKVTDTQPETEDHTPLAQTTISDVTSDDVHTTPKSELESVSSTETAITDLVKPSDEDISSATEHDILHTTPAASTETTQIASQEPTVEDRDDFGVKSTTIASSPVEHSTPRSEISGEIPDMQLPEAIPGEGDCLVGQKTYKNDTAIPPSNVCEESCRCVSSIVVCQRVECAIPENIESCTLVVTSVDKCCPTYKCGDEIIEGTTVASAPHEIKSDVSSTTQHPTEGVAEGDEHTTDMAPTDIDIPTASTEKPMSHVKDDEDDFTTKSEQPALATETPFVAHTMQPSMAEKTPDEPLQKPAEDKHDTLLTTLPTPLSPETPHSTKTPSIDEFEVQSTPTSSDKEPHTTLPSIESEKEPIDEHLAHTTVSTIPKDEKVPIDEAEGQTGAPSIGDEPHTTLPTIESEKEPIDERLDHTTISSIGADKVPIDETMVQTDAPSIGDEKESTEESLDHSSPPSVPRDEEKPTEDMLEHTVAPAIEGEKESTEKDLTSTAAPVVEGGKKPSIDTLTHPTRPSTRKDEISEAISHTASPIGDGEKGQVDESLDHTTLPTDGVEKEPVEGISDHTTVPSIEKGEDGVTDKILDHTVILSVDEEKESTDSILAHTPSVETSTVPSVGKDEKQPSDDALDHTITPAIDGEKVPTDQTLDHTTVPSVKKDEAEPKDETVAVTIAPSTESKEGTTEDLSTIKDTTAHSIEEDLLHTTIPSVQKDDKEPHTTVTLIESVSESVDHTTLPTIAAEGETTGPATQKDVTPTIDGAAPSDDETLAHTTVPSIKIDDLGQTIPPHTEKESTDKMYPDSVTPSAVEGEKGHTDETLISTTDSSIHKDEKKPSEEIPDHTALPGIADDELPSTVTPSLPKDETVAYTTLPSTIGEDGKEPDKSTDETLSQTTVPSILIDDHKLTDAAMSHTISPATIEGEKEPTEEILGHTTLPSIKKDEKEPVEELDHTVAPIILSAESESGKKPAEEFTPAPATRKDDKQPGEDVFEHTISPVGQTGSPATSSDVSGPTVTPTIAGEKKPDEETMMQTTLTSVTKESVDEILSQTTLPSIQGEKEPIDETLGHTVIPPPQDHRTPTDETLATTTTIPSLSKEEKKPGDGILDHTIPSVESDQVPTEDTLGHTDIPTTAGVKEPTVETLSSTTVPSIRKDDAEDTTGQTPSIDAGEIEAHTLTPSVEGDKETTEQGLTPTAHTLAPSIEGEKGSTEESSTPVTGATGAPGAPSVEGEKESTEEGLTPTSHTLAPAIEGEKGSSTESAPGAPSVEGEKESTVPTDHTLAPSIEGEKESTEESLTPITGAPGAPSAEDKKEPTEEGFTPTPPSIEGEKVSTEESLTPMTGAPGAPGAPPSEGEKESTEGGVTPTAHTLAPAIEGEKGSSTESAPGAPSVEGEKESTVPTDHTLAPSIEGEKGSTEESLTPMAGAPGAPSAEDKKEPTEEGFTPTPPSIEGEKVSTEESLTPVTGAPGVPGAPPSEGEKESTEGGVTPTAHTLAPAIEGEKGSTTESAPGAPGAPSVEGEEESTEEGMTPTSHTLAPAIEGEKGSTTESAPGAPGAPSVEGEEQSTEEGSTPSAHTLAPSIEGEEGSTEVSSTPTTGAPGAPGVPSAGGEEQSTEEGMTPTSHTLAPAIEGEKGSTTESAPGAPGAPSVEGEEESTEEGMTPTSHTLAPAVEGEKGSTTENAPGAPGAPSVEGEKESTVPTDHTLAPSIEGEKESTEESLTPITGAPGAPSAEGEKESTEEDSTPLAPTIEGEKGSTDESLTPTTGAPGAPGVPSAEGEKELTEEGVTPTAHTLAPAIEVDKGSTEESSTPITGAPGAPGEPSTKGEKASTEESSTPSAHTLAPTIEGEMGSTEESLTPTTGAPGAPGAPSTEGEKEPTEEGVTPTDHTLAPAIEGEKGSTEESSTPITGAPGAPSADGEKESTEEGLTPAAHTLAPSIEGEKGSTEESLVPVTHIAPAEGEEQTTKEGLAPTTIPSVTKEEKKPSDDLPLPIDESLDHTVAPPAEGQKEPTEETLAHTAPPKVEGEIDDTLTSTTVPSVEKDESKPTDAHTISPSEEGEMGQLGETSTQTPTSIESGAAEGGEKEHAQEPIHVTIPTVSDESQTSEGIHMDSMAHTVAPDGIESTPSTSTPDEKLPEISTAPTALDTAKPDVESSTGIIPDGSTKGPFDDLAVQTTLGPIYAPEERKTTHAPPILADLNPVDEGEDSVESVEETTDHKVQHVGEFVTERIEESTVHGTQKIDRPETSGEEGEEGEQLDEKDTVTDSFGAGTTTTTTAPAKQETVSTSAQPEIIPNEPVSPGEDGLPTTLQPDLVEPPIASVTAAPELGVMPESENKTQVPTSSTTPKTQIADSTESVSEEGLGGEPATEKTESEAEKEKEHPSTEHEADVDITTSAAHPLYPDQIATTASPAVIDDRIDVANTTTSADTDEISTPTTTTSTTVETPITTGAPQPPHYPPGPPIYGQPQYPSYSEDEYTDEDESEVFGPGTCRYGGKLYVSAQQIPRDDPCDFCFCFRSDIICLQQSCPPPISGCHEEPISGFCCPRYECPVSMATVLNITTSTTTTSTTLPPHFLHHSYGSAVQRNGCQINGRSYKVGEKIESTSGPCIHCSCGGDGKMKCDPQACVPEPTMQQVMAVVAAGRKR